MRININTIVLAFILMLWSNALAGQPTGARGLEPIATDEDAIAALDVDATGMGAVKNAVQSHDLAAAKRAYLDYRRTACPAKYTVAPSEKPVAAVEKADSVGDEIARHFIRNSYGFIPRNGDMGQPFDWKANPVPRSSPSYTYEWTYCVISRTGFWKDLANAYWKTLDEKYAQVWVDQFLDFVAKNPSDDQPPAGSLWRTLDASERMYDSWPYCYAHFVNSPAFTPAVQWTYLRSVLDHVRILKAGLELRGRTGNWVASECYALYAIGVLFPELRDAAAWRDYAMARMVKELDLCVPPDGFEAELTPNYHYFTLSSFTGPVQLAQLNHLPIPSVFLEKIRAMYRAPVWVMDQRGFVVCTNDGGPHNAAAHARTGLTMLGSDPLLEWAASAGVQGEQPPTSTMLPYAGFYTMRGGWNPNDTFLFFRAGPTGLAHEHEDMLEVVLRAFNRTLLFEQGNYEYDQSEWRRFVLGTSSHSTIIVDGNGQHRGRSNVPVTQPVSNPWVTTPIFDFVSGTYDKGYQKSIHDLKKLGSGVSYVGPIDRSVAHTRRVIFLKPYYAVVLDSVNGTGTHTFDSLYYMDSPSAEIDASTQAAFSHNTGDVQLGLYPLDRDQLTAESIVGQMDPILGWYADAHRQIATIRFHKTQAAPAQFATFLYPFLGAHPDFHATPLAVGDGAWGQSIHTPFEEANVAVSLDDSPRAMTFDHGLVNATAAGLIVRARTHGDELIGGWKLTHFASDSCDLKMDVPSTLIWQRTAKGLLIFNGSDDNCALQITVPFKTSATILPKMWTLVTVDGQKEAQAPPLFEPVVRAYPEPVYQDYLKAAPRVAEQNSMQTIHVSADQFILPAHVGLKSKAGTDHPVVAAWDDADSLLTAKVNLPAEGWYHLIYRYCTGDKPMRSILINGVFPFRQAHDFVFPSAIGDAPSDGWSNHTNDWKDITLGEADTKGAWLFHLPKGDVSIALQNDGGGLNVDTLDLVPASSPSPSSSSSQ